MKKQILRRQSLQFQMKPLAFEQMGKKLIRVTCYLLGTGINRNGSNITKEAVLKANDKLAHLPVVGHLMQDEHGNYYLGGHDYKIEENGKEWEVTPLTVPLGCIAGDKKFEFVKIDEQDTGITREYLKVDMIIWNHMSPVMEAAYNKDVYFNHSIEIDNVDGAWDETNNFRIDSFEYDRACLLGLDSEKWSIKHTEPCFPESKVYPSEYAKKEDFNKQFALLLQEIQRFNLEQASNVDNSKLNTASKEAIETYDNPNNKKEEDVPMGNILFHEVCSKIKALLAEHSFKHKTGKNYDKYVLLNICEADKSAIVVDREDSYCAFKVPYVATKTADGLVVNLDYDNKTTMALGATESTDCVFKVKEEVEMIANDLSAYEVEHFGSSKLDELNKSLEESKAQFETAQARVAELEKHLAVFEKEKIQYMEQKHKDIIDTLVASRREEMGKFSEYLDYCIKIDYKKTVEQVEKDIKEIHYNFMLKNNKGGGKKSYSAIEVDVAEGSGVEGNSIAERYGEDIAKYFK